jgi:hypothetical protein
MKVGDLVHMPGSIEPTTGIILRAPIDRGDGPAPRVQVYWMADAAVSWEPRKWLAVINPS